MHETQTDALRLLRELRPGDESGPFDPDSPSAAASLERIVRTPRPPRRPQRSPARSAVAVVVAAAVAAAIVAVDPFVRPSDGGVVARAAEALTDREVILHFVARERHQAMGGRGLDEDDPSTYTERRLEAWQTAGRRQERYVYDGVLESVIDVDRKLSLSYDVARDLLIRHANPAIFEPGARMLHGLDATVPMAGHSLGDVARLLERARQGEGAVRVIGETTVRGVPVHEVRLDFDVDVVELDDRGGVPRAGSDDDLPAHEEPAGRLVYLDRETDLPVRVVDVAPDGTVVRITDFLAVERLPRSRENERLLEMSPHPGAREETR